jgi:hypothetical protein
MNLEVSPLGFPVKGRFRYQNRVFFKLPFTLAPTVSDGQSSFEVVYYLKVRWPSPRFLGRVPWSCVLSSLICCVFRVCR